MRKSKAFRHAVALGRRLSLLGVVSAASACANPQDGSTSGGGVSPAPAQKYRVVSRETAMSGASGAHFKWNQDPYPTLQSVVWGDAPASDISLSQAASRANFRIIQSDRSTPNRVEWLDHERVPAVRLTYPLGASVAGVYESQAITPKNGGEAVIPVRDTRSVEVQSGNDGERLVYYTDESRSRVAAIFWASTVGTRIAILFDQPITRDDGLAFASSVH